MNLRQLRDALKEAIKWLDWDREVIEDFHEYAQRFGGQPGTNVYTFVLREALAARGLTLEQFRRENKKRSSA